MVLAAGLHGDSVLQTVFAVAAYGWFDWVRGSKDTAGLDDLLIRDAAARKHFGE